MYGAETSVGAPTTNGAPSTVPAHQQQSAEDLGIIIEAVAKIQKDIANVQAGLAGIHQEIKDIKWHVANDRSHRVGLPQVFA